MPYIKNQHEPVKLCRRKEDQEIVAYWIPSPDFYTAQQVMIPIWLDNLIYPQNGSWFLRGIKDEKIVVRETDQVYVQASKAYMPLIYSYAEFEKYHTMLDGSAFGLIPSSPIHEITRALDQFFSGNGEETEVRVIEWLTIKGYYISNKVVHDQIMQECVERVNQHLKIVTRKILDEITPILPKESSPYGERKGSSEAAMAEAAGRIGGEASTSIADESENPDLRFPV